MLLPVFLLLACTLFLSSGCAVTQDGSSYSPAYSSSYPSRRAPADVQVAVNPVNRVQHSDVAAAARSSIGSPYRFGGSSPETGFDCSGLVCWSFEQMGVNVPRRAQDQLYAGGRVLQKSELRPGDIVVFKGTNNRTGWHSGIYTGDGNFVHSPRAGKNVTESNLAEEYFARRFVGGSRISGDSGGLMAAAYAPASRMLGANGRRDRDVVTASAQRSGSAKAKASSPAKAKNDKKSLQTASGKSKNSKQGSVAAAKAKGKGGKTVASAGSKKTGQSKNATAARNAKTNKKTVAAKGKKQQAVAASKKKPSSIAVASAAKSQNSAAKSAGRKQAGSSAKQKTTAQKSSPKKQAATPSAKPKLQSGLSKAKARNI